MLSLLRNSFGLSSLFKLVRVYRSSDFFGSAGNWGKRYVSLKIIKGSFRYNWIMLSFRILSILINYIKNKKWREIEKI